MSHRVKIVQVLTCLFFLFCLCGLIWQLCLVSELYFKYKVTTRINIAIPDEIPSVGISFCTRFTDVLEFEKLNAGSNRTWSYGTGAKEVLKYQDEMTVREIFAYTPDVKQSIKEVIFRKRNSFERLHYTGNQVYRFVDVIKYVNLEHICYRFRIKQSRSMSYRYYAITPSAPGVIYEFRISDKFAKAELIKISLHDETSLPYRSLKITPVILRQYDDQSKRAKYNTFKASQIRLQSNLLTAPYETDCYDYQPTFQSDEHCHQQCVMTKTMDQLDLAPFSVFITNSTIDRTMISFEDLKKHDLVERLMRIETTCHRDCYKKQCDMSTSMTAIAYFVSHEFGLQVTVPSQPWIMVYASPSLTLIEFLTYLMSTVSTWTGMSIISLSPLRLMSKGRQLKMRENVTGSRTRTTHTLAVQQRD